MGDFNARTGTLNDFVELDQISRVDIDLLPSNYLEDVNLPIHQNVDQGVNDQGKQLLDTCIDSKLRIINGRMILGDSLGYNKFFGPKGEVVLLITLLFPNNYFMNLILLMFVLQRNCPIIVSYGAV